VVTTICVEPNVYRAVIDEVIAAIRPEFDEYGVSEVVLGELQHVRMTLHTHTSFVDASPISLV
jgi:hypothetical protein